MDEADIVAGGDVLVIEGSRATVCVAFGSTILKNLLKASPDDPKHPGWPAGTPDGMGGKFRPTGGAAKERAKAAVERLAMRRAIRALLLQALSLPAEELASFIPFLSDAVGTITAVQLANTAVELHQLDIDAKAALDFIAAGPYTLDELRVGSGSESFSSYDEFYKRLPFDEILALRFGSAGPGYQYHHIVEQGGTNATLPASELQSTDNIIRIPTLLHEAINSAYSRKSEKTGGLILRNWLRSQPFSTQSETGIKLLQDFGLLK